MDTERRTNKRIPLQLPVLFCAEGRPPLPCRTRDISRAGAMIEVTAPVRLGAEVLITFDGEGFGQPLFLQARVRRLSQGRCVGVKFDFGSPEESDRFCQGVRQLIKKGRGAPAERAGVIIPPYSPAGENASGHSQVIPDRLVARVQCGCGWEGMASRFARRCPRCNSRLDAVTATG